ncbi:hypothetical protein Ddye_012464 [Dipteronia dyeriana]|uniref:Uncharacterized protein n=1 Tax=Dipteronia dyeriana TaxID=168575 RepID=A0AAD9X4D9_9ROSI|nr:hypothetical protein Ddye_012464 [Dipteronia dyeriana]
MKRSDFNRGVGSSDCEDVRLASGKAQRFPTKGNGVFPSKVRQKPTFHSIPNGRLILDKKKEASAIREMVREGDGFTLAEGSEEGHNGYYRGETSGVDLGQQVGGNIIIDLSNDMDKPEGPMGEEVDRFNGREKEKKRVTSSRSCKRVGSAKIQGMTTYKARCQAITVVEERDRVTNLIGNSVGSWNMEVEVAKVIEKAVALGCLN